ncbi:venom serine protease-like [Toxorhynchites rutilus septentrionalis]|uniref:venom serine protease-like n=1 Tax=Toxorhynchites rutilus septentrionalis TaxID=329112 RepID=UPI00247A584E|nr:venom serine protease-like [Toxorhynchites rutilus septentrionalis]
MWRFSSVICMLAVLKLCGGQGIYAGCDYLYKYDSKAVGYIQSPNWSNYYRGGTNCRYTIQVPPRHYVFAQCYDMYLPSSFGCYYDRLLVSPSGDPSLGDAEVHCGTTPFNMASNGTKMVFALQTSALSNGGRFRCQITAVPIPCDCGRRKMPFIVGGESTKPNEFPMMAALIDLESRGLTCGATVITNRHALTAAHCLNGRMIANTALLVGDHNMSSGTDTPHAKLMLISSFIVHSEYNSVIKRNDIALVRTAVQIEFNAGVGRACLPFVFTGDDLAGADVEALGWGTIDFGAPLAQDLQKVTLQVISLSSCRDRLKDFNTVQENQLCTYTATKDTCQYDSGGPLLYTDQNAASSYVVGVTNYGISCASRYPSVSARVASYLDWIEANTDKFKFCEK